MADNPLLSTTTTISTESSFSHLSLSDFSSHNHNQTSLPFQQDNRAKSTALCYYHHLYNQRTAESSRNLLPLYNYTYKNESQTKFSEYGSTRFSSRQENFSGNYNQSKSSNYKLNKTSDSDGDSISEKSLDKLITALLNSPFKNKPLAAFRSSIRDDTDFCGGEKVSAHAAGEVPRAVICGVSKQLTLTRQLKSKHTGYKKSCSQDRCKTSSPIYENMSLFGKLNCYLLFNGFHT